MKVVKHEADSEKGKYTAVLKGSDAGNFVGGSIIEVDLKLKGKVEDLLDQFPMGSIFKVDVNSETKE